MSKIPKKNEEITATEIRLISHNGDMLGVVSTKEAIAQAKMLKLDLLEISPNSNPPVCKILDFGKYKYDAKKKESDSKQKTHKIEQKEIKMTPNIGIHDYETKFKKIIQFLDDGHRVSIIVQLKGRERNVPEKAKECLLKITQQLEEYSTIVVPPSFSGNSGSVTFAPKKK
jgi:translation initiation factor IF-3